MNVTSDDMNITSDDMNITSDDTGDSGYEYHVCYYLWCGEANQEIIFTVCVWLLVLATFWLGPLYQYLMGLYGDFVGSLRGNDNDSGGALQIEISTYQGYSSLADTSKSTFDAPTPQPDRKAVRLDAIGVARILASVHIVLGHMLNKNIYKNGEKLLFLTDGVPNLGWGFTWVPWFFMLSGFILTYARLNSSEPGQCDPPLKFLWKRLASIFPIYAMTLCITASLVVIHNEQTYRTYHVHFYYSEEYASHYYSHFPDRWILCLQSFLLHSFVPQSLEQTFDMHSWFLSALILYWLGFKFVYLRMREASFHVTCGMLIALAAIPWGSVMIPPIIGEDQDWYRYHTYFGTDPLDIWVLILKFHPLCYIHVFVFGMFLARLLLLINTVRDTIPRALQLMCDYGAVLGYSVILSLFAIFTPGDVYGKISWRLSVLMPFQGLILLGLSLNKDPLSKLFQRAPAVVGEASFVQYMIQFEIYQIWMVRPIDAPYLWFLLSLFGIAVLLTVWVQKPAIKLWLQNPGYTYAAPFVLLATLLTLREISDSNF
ncbi:hypothetical protein CYMTET_31793 [Cymbomonas tetramitiformis]|uniref:Acyltransferase 3 domain-containing protein n=1 Tax=Cymbomonas tetramitiformis TaxID=36881 RepID=A0AAE0FGL6_9CHLO|nr:hypothetical protein CYMTET_31793 [Cymbomonas tetramitiformis]|eukprot:gene27901-34470_t